MDKNEYQNIKLKLHKYDQLVIELSKFSDFIKEVTSDKDRVLTLITCNNNKQYTYISPEKLKSFIIDLLFNYRDQLRKEMNEL